ncbi:right-handed parallel beta-helix repeat-containing protein [Herbaspirillum sp. SJZ107]|uniref:right-handed parallel beta-helix repeat-containing protein n=1 Tax=Herbaspirillum sp. SJZ107 TaxID=2572881 RepID=UPI001151D1C2|nr:right-handed parallel beta-helix repeat-containing protein [Herbaspirillum sp. SJZ107]TQK05112.1 parallel beta-helix repeat protein [Herbaspirillum sp. SJZ107]
MATYYIDPSVPGPGNGTLASPFRSWTGVTWAPGNTYLQKRGTTYAGVFRLAASGTATQRITVGAYYGADGSDDPSRPKPVILLPGAPTTPANGASIAVYRQERDFITYRNLDIRNTALPEASDVAIIWLGNDCIFENSNVTSNCAGIYMFEKSRVTVSGCVLDVVNNSAAYANHGILVAGNVAIDSIRIAGNTIYHRGGGTSTSHGIRCETYAATLFLTRLVISGNRVSPPPGTAYSRNRGANGIYLVRGASATLERNTVTGMLTGIFINNGDSNYVGYNNCSNNMNFGIHINGVARAFLIEGNTCNANGGTLSPNYYGRGIELSSVAGQDAVSGHTIRLNVCRFNINYGGPLDNGTEGVGIGLDDGTSKCTVYGNLLSNNEGNGIQLYGGGDRTKYTDTGGHTIMSNLMDSNCTYSVLNRRSGGTTPSRFQYHIQLAYTYGSRTLISNNTFMGSTRGGIYVDSTSSNVVAMNNLYLGVPFPLNAAGEGKGRPAHAEGLPAPAPVPAPDILMPGT